MGLREAKINWSNFLRQAVGLPKQYEVKVKRDALAKQYPMIGIKKDGDVGFDLVATESIVVPAMSQEHREKYLLLEDYRNSRVATAKRLGIEGGVEAINIDIDAQVADMLPRAVIPTGIFLDMPMNVWCSLEARSSASTKLLITPDAIIDSGYRGELFAVVFNLGYADYHVEAGERIVQAIFRERTIAKISETEVLSESQRGVTGFGSTGLQ